MKMAGAKKSSNRNWWSNQFIEALESYTEPGRLKRGRSYSSSYRLKSFEIDGGLVLAKVRGSVNPYFGVTKEPTYVTSLEFRPISRAHWASAIARISTNAGLISKLMMNEIPDNIEDSFSQLNLKLLPQGINDCKTSCTCPDFSNPCKHVAGLFYRVAQELDQDPFLLFQLRGLPKDALLQELSKSPLGQALCGELSEDAVTAEPVASLYCRPEVVTAPPDLSLRDFWQGASAAVPAAPASAGNMQGKESVVAAIAIKKQGDYPPFWPRSNSFIEAMEAFYQHIRDKNKDFLK